MKAAARRRRARTSMLRKARRLEQLGMTRAAQYWRTRADQI